ncbi:MAG: hypothetical protein SNJ76_00705 [Fimbriimonadaceae bacterium]
MPRELLAACAEVFDVLPIDAAMPDLVPTAAARREAVDAVKSALAAPIVAAHPELAAGLWLYVDELDKSHTVSQKIPTASGSFWHAIMHRREGDFGNSLYWVSQTASHPVWDQIEGYDPRGFVEACRRRHRENPADLVDMQRREWAALFAFCAGRGD